MSRSTAVSRGTVEDTTRPVTSAERRARWDRNWVRSRACSSDVRSALVAIRQCVDEFLAVVQADDGLGVAGVDREEHQG